jgi:GTPase SAR1 family protein
MNDLSHIREDFRENVSMSDEQRIRFFNQTRWIGYTRANRIIETLAEYMNRPQRPRTVGLLLTGPSNNGKTTIVNRFMELYGERYMDHEEDPKVPVIVTQAPDRPDERGLYASIIDQLWENYKLTAPIIKLRYQAIHLMRLCDVKILIIDELHSLLSGSVIKRKQVLNALKSLSNELKIPIVGVGTKDALTVIETDKQHASRFDVMTLPKWKLGPELQRMLVNFEMMLPLKKKSVLGDAKKARLLHFMSDGNLGDLHRLLIDCATKAIKSGKERIDIDIIKSCFYADGKTKKPYKVINLEAQEV